MLQSLIPAFSQLLAPEKREQFNALYSRGIRLIVISLIPAIVIMFVLAHPFFTIWAGPEFGEESTLPFYILLVGLFFNILAYIPHGAIMASGRTEIFAKLYWIELVIYAALAAVLIYEFQAPGAAMAWSLRLMFDAFVITWLAKRTAGATFRFTDHLLSILGGIGILRPTVVLTVYNNYSPWLLLIVPVSLLVYGVFIWKTGVEAGEREWIKYRAARLFGFEK
jgi:O-antigen/teichoic acid export membrane protein